jgi:HK97 family phage major capsid protein
MYGKTRSTANRLAPDAAADTYVAVAGALTTAILRNAMTKVEIEGARRENLRIVTNPQIRDDIFELEDGNQNYFNAPKFGFDGQISYDGVPVIVDSSCPTDSLFVVDFESYYIVISRGPQMIGLAKVGAADDAYISVYLAAVYEQPRRIHMLNTLS